MGKREDIKSILVIGSGPIVIGQACEFDYSGTQACKVLMQEGYEVILVNSNPATIMTDPNVATKTYIEPLNAEVLKKIILKEKPDALLPTLGGQTALNLSMELYRQNFLNEQNVEMIGANAKSIECAENRDTFKKAMEEIGLKVCRSGIANSIEEAVELAETIGFPIMIRPSFILGGAGTGIAKNRESFLKLATEGINSSPVHEILIEESIAGFKEFELEVMRDNADNCVIICSIENLDPMGVHTGDSITVAPQQTLSDVEYQMMRDQAFKIIRKVGVETGGSNIQFAVNPTNGEMTVIEMNPRVSRSSALASKATGFPIAKIAAKLAVGYRLDEVLNDITKVTPASFEPTIDYVVTKIPRFAFEKLPGTSGNLGTRMQSVGEVMAIGRTFGESLQKAIRSKEEDRFGLNCDTREEVYTALSTDELLDQIVVATPDRIFLMAELLYRGLTIQELYDVTKIDNWFLNQMDRIVQFRKYMERAAKSVSIKDCGYDLLKKAKNLGFSEEQLAKIFNCPPEAIRERLKELNINVTFKAVDTCAGEFEAFTPYFYATFEDETELLKSQKNKIIILGSGPNRIGQGIEFDYCCVHASMALQEAGYETIMVNCNPETVSTDYDTSTKLYFEPLTESDLKNIIDAEKDACEDGSQLAGVIVGLGGQTPLKLAGSIDPKLILGTSPKSIDRAEDRDLWSKVCQELNITQPLGGTALNLDEALKVAGNIGFPVLIRPSYVLGGRAMEIVYNEDDLVDAWKQLELFEGVALKENNSFDHPVLIDRFLEDAVEVDVDAIRDKNGSVIIGGILEHVEEAGVHSGDSACAIPTQNLSADIVATIEDQAARLAHELNVIGPINVQFAVQKNEVYVIEANPRASRTLPFTSKAINIPLAKIAALVMAGHTIQEIQAIGYLPEKMPLGPSSNINLSFHLPYVAVKEAVLPFYRFPEVDSLLGPEMRSTGEVMGVDLNFGTAFAKSQMAAGASIPVSGNVFISLADRDKLQGVTLAKELSQLGFGIYATEGTAKFFEDSDITVTRVVPKRTTLLNMDCERLDKDLATYEKIDVSDLLKNSEIALIINTPRGRGARADGDYIRRASSAFSVPCITTMSAAMATIEGMKANLVENMEVRTLQELGTFL